ncbi:MAG TPA: VOC family protein [Candidatus Polarisedimenticolaceae bacterium]
MSDAASKIGIIPWCDLTVPDAAAIRDFYAEVVGWTSTGVDMGEYEDFCMNEPGEGQTVAGICHARGTNAGLPAQWLVYITVDDAAKAASRAVAKGGKILRPPGAMGPQGRYCVIQDPAGAVCALFQKG